MEVMPQYYPCSHGELKEELGNGLTEALMGGKDNVTLHTVNGNGDDSMKGSMCRMEEEEEAENAVLLSGEGRGHKSSVYLDEDGGMWRCRECVWAYKLGNPCMDDDDSEGKRLPFHFGNGEATKTMISASSSSAEIGNVGELGRLVSAAGGGAMEEEVIELEFFDRREAIDKLHTHNAYCPNCRSPISKVILRIKRETTSTRPDPIPIPDNKFDLLGCLACFRIFLPNKTLTTHETTEEEEQQNNSASHEQGAKCFDLLWFFGGTPKALKQTSPSPTITSDQGIASTTSTQQETPAPPPEMIVDDDVEPHYSGMPSRSGLSVSGGDVGGAVLAASLKPKPEITQEKNNDGVKIQGGGGGDVRIPIDESPNKAGTGTGTSTQTQTPEERGGGGDSKSVDVVKSIVYGGLMESITSLSVVSSAAASGATTLNAMTIGVANLIGGFFVVAHNLLDLKTNRPEDEYHKVLGQRNHFLLHAILAMLAYLVFGLAPPVLYGFTFRESDDRDSKLLGVAVASFACILLLAIGKAYTSGAKTFKQYFLTLLQYAIAAATASGVAYAVGHLFQKLMDELGWFNSTPTPTHALLLPNINSTNPNSAFYSF